jgi:hypothetical protein
MPVAYVADRISAHMGRTPENFLLCCDVVIARTGWQQYRGEEIGIEASQQIFDVWRDPQEVFDARTMASAEGKPVCLRHPPTFLDPNNASWYAKGHLQNVRRSKERLEDGEEGLIADLIITDAALIDAIENGLVRECSLGYACRYIDRGDGRYEQTDMLVNHLAVVEAARAGREARIQDSGEGVTDRQVQQRLDQVLALCDAVLSKHGRVDSRTITAPSGGTDALAAFDAARKAGEEFSDAARRAGQEMQKRFMPAGCTATAEPVAEHADEDFRAAALRVGKAMRGER